MQGLDQGGGCDDGKKPVVSDRVHTAVTDRSGGVFAWFLGASCLGLAILVVLLARQNRSLRAQLDAALSNLSPAGANAAGPAKPRGGELHIGDQLEPLATFGSPLGDALRFSGGSAATLLFVFGGDCEACEAMDEVFARLTSAAAGFNVVAVGIQADAAKPEDLKRSGRRFVVCGAADKRGTWLGRITTVPGMALVDPSGRVRGAWWGVLDGARELEVVRAMEGLGEAQR